MGPGQRYRAVILRKSTPDISTVKLNISGYNLFKQRPRFALDDNLIWHSIIELFDFRD